MLGIYIYIYIYTHTHANIIIITLFSLSLSLFLSCARLPSTRRSDAWYVDAAVLNRATRHNNSIFVKLIMIINMFYNNIIVSLYTTQLYAALYHDQLVQCPLSLESTWMHGCSIHNRIWGDAITVICVTRKGRWYGWKRSSSSNCSIRVVWAYPLVEFSQTAPCRASRGNRISVNSTLPPS